MRCILLTISMLVFTVSILVILSSEVKSLKNQLAVLDMKYNYMCLELTSGDSNIHRGEYIITRDIRLKEKLQ